MSYCGRCGSSTQYCQCEVCPKCDNFIERCGCQSDNPIDDDGPMYSDFGNFDTPEENKREREKGE